MEDHFFQGGVARLTCEPLYVTQQGYNSLMLLHMDKDYYDHLDLNANGNEFSNTTKSQNFLFF